MIAPVDLARAVQTARVVNPTWSFWPIKMCPAFARIADLRPPPFATRLPAGGCAASWGERGLSCRQHRDKLRYAQSRVGICPRAVPGMASGSSVSAVLRRHERRDPRRSAGCLGASLASAVGLFHVASGSFV